MAAKTMNARYSGKCRCGSRVQAGDQIQWAGQIIGCPSCVSSTPVPVSPSASVPVVEMEAETASPELLQELESLLEGETVSSSVSPVSVPVSSVSVSSPTEIEEAYQAAIARLDPDQKLVADWMPADGSLRVVASAGSGKTSSSVVLLASLVRKGIHPSQIVATTFTSKAGKELADRLDKVIPANILEKMRVGTFHGLALRSLRASDPKTWKMDHCMDIPGRAGGIPSSLQLWSKVVNGWDTIPGINHQGLSLENADPKAYALAADQIRSKMLTPGSVEADREALQVEVDLGLKHFCQAWKLLQEAKKNLGAWDFADALASWHSKLQTGSKAGTAEVVLVDEATDNSMIQLEIARLLAGNNGKVVLLGDLSQSVYSWRSAFPEFFQNADKLLNAKTLQIRTNYRSVKEVVDLGNRINEGKSWNLGDPSVSSRTTEGSVKISGNHADPAAEAAAIASQIQDRINDGTKLGDIAVLVRTNSQSGPVEAALVQAKIPCVVVKGTPFFDQKEVKDVLAYIKLAVKDDVESLGRIINKPRRYLGKKFVEDVSRKLSRSSNLMAAIEDAAAYLKRGQRDGCEDLLADLASLQACEWPQTAELAAKILTYTGQEELGDEDKSGIPSAVVAVAKTFSSAEEFLEFAEKCGIEVTSTEEKESDGKVTIATVHSVKGLEFKHVIVLTSEGVFPHSRSLIDPKRLEEETRLFYVAVTRAADTLDLFWSSRNVYGKPAGPSQFLKYVEVPDPDLDPNGRNKKDKKTDDNDPHDHDNPSQDKWPSVEDCNRVKNLLTFVDGLPTPSSSGLMSASPVVHPSWQESLQTAKILAKDRGEQEPKADNKSKSVLVFKEGFEELLSIMGFSSMPTDQARQYNQRVWQLPLDSSGDSFIRVYSTVPLFGDQAREVGEDSIRVSLVWKEKPIAKKEPWVCRTRNWRSNLLDRLEKLMSEWTSIQKCPRCKSPMKLRDGYAGKKFWGCLDFPKCTGSRN